MNRSQIRRLAGMTVAATLMLAALAVGPAAAKTPGWQFINVQTLPETVGANSVAGYRFTITNAGKSNISALYLTDSVNAAPEFVWNSRGTTCDVSPNLRCAFGALNSGASIDVIVAYRVGNATFNNTFQLDSTGDPAGDNQSHGDSLLQAVSTNVSTSANFAGSFTLDTSTLQTVGTLGSSNKQTSSVEPPETLIPVTVQDGITSGVACTIAACSNQLGEWTSLNVANGKAYSSAFKVTLTVWKGAVPGGVSADEIDVLHTTDAGTTYVIAADCPASGPIISECRTVTKVGQNYRIVIWLLQNGTLRGTW